MVFPKSIPQRGARCAGLLDLAAVPQLGLSLAAGAPWRRSSCRSKKMGRFHVVPGGTPLSLDDLNGKKRGKSMKTRIRRIDDWMILDGVALFQETSIWPPFIGVLWGRW